ncbi:MAG: Methylmalonyl-CoA mutase large subunit [Syntrophorhabdus sp. PtaB.Bin006]|nr:MAG: Methylmalonyl-CoA mutase large subunit [Syntrophorhabdus sp. PtaB.Bin006]
MAGTIRILIAKPGLDGHDKGAKVVAQALKDAGMDVIYTGLHQSVEDIVNAALREDVDVVGLSILSGTHLSICEKVIRQMREKGIGHKMVVVGGVIPEHDMPRLREMGVKGVFPNGTTFDAIISFLKENLAGPR